MSDNKKGFLQVNNQIVDYWMAELTNAEFKTLLAIVRKTKGWNKPYDRISQSQIAELTGLTTRSVRTAIALLEEKKLIIVAGDDSKTRLFSVNYHTVNDVDTDVTAIEKAIKDAEVIYKDAEVISHNEEVISRDAEADFHHNRQTKDTINKQTIDKADSVKKTKVVNIAFSDFWNTYDKKKDTAKCEKKWKSLTDKERDLVMVHIVAYTQSTPDKKFRKNPITYLNGKCWLDDIDQPTAANKINRATDKLAVNNNWANANQSNMVAANTDIADMF